MSFAFIDATGGASDAPAFFVMDHRSSASVLLRKLQVETRRTGGVSGAIWVAENTTVMMQPDRRVFDSVRLIKRVRATIKKAGFRIAKVVLTNPDGSVFDQDEDEDEDKNETQDEGEDESDGTDDERIREHRTAIDTFHVTERSVTAARREPPGLIFANSNRGDAERPHPVRHGNVMT